MSETHERSEKLPIRLQYGDKSEIYMVGFRSALGKCFRTYKSRNVLLLTPPVVFSFEGRSLHDRDTPASLEMRENDTITVLSRGLSG